VLANFHSVQAFELGLATRQQLSGVVEGTSPCSDADQADTQDARLSRHGALVPHPHHRSLEDV
jgi:hypothetical protein